MSKREREREREWKRKRNIHKKFGKTKKVMKRVKQNRCAKVRGERDRKKKILR